MILGLVILLLGITWFTFPKRNEQPAPIFPATVNRDCAPWDGGAFTVSIPMEDGTIIDISIWQAPDIKAPVTFSFPDDTGQVGNASYRPASGEFGQLNGKVFFRRVEEGSQVEGRFEFATETGQGFDGQFEAEWGNQIMLCG